MRLAKIGEIEVGTNCGKPLKAANIMASTKSAIII
jgi:hypothetical protein